MCVYLILLDILDGCGNLPHTTGLESLKAYQYRGEMVYEIIKQMLWSYYDQHHVLAVSKKIF